MVGLDRHKDTHGTPINPNHQLGLRVLMHRSDGTLVLLVNQKEYWYWCDNAKLLQMLPQLEKPINKAVWLKELQRCSRYYLRKYPNQK